MQFLQQRWVRICLLLLPACALLCILLLRNTAFWIARDVLPPCSMYTALGIYCPGCGMTRCLLALLCGDVLLAIRQNAAIFSLLVLIVLVYGECLLHSFGRSVHLLPRKTWFWIAFGICVAVYLILRNIIPALMPLPVTLS
jgi:hypothetical protein